MSGVIHAVDSLMTPPAVAPITVAYARKHIKALTHSDDVLIDAWIRAAAAYFEEQTGRQTITATWEQWGDAFPLGRGRIELPHPPLQSVTSVQYIAADGTLTDFVDGASPAAPLYAVKAPQGPYAPRGWIEPAFGNQWPIARCESGAVRIQYVAGYGPSVEDVPELVAGILCYLVAHFDQFRAPVHEQQRGSMIVTLPLGLEAMLTAFKYTALPTLPLLRHGWFADGVPWR
jgi:uncharacterized phiE125 gp8 family phage protein